jgi:tetratricopeptide (TPR) repeat protein
MDKIHRFLIIFLLIANTSLELTAQQPASFQEVERQSFDLYQKGEWKELIRFSNEALKEGFDYYYLRVRAGIACFETKKYMRAALHFRQALSFNENDFLAGEYLYGCYLELNKSMEAYEIYKKLPPSSREKLKKSLYQLQPDGKIRHPGP